MRNICLLIVAGLVINGAQCQKPFHEHYLDFENLIVEEVGDVLQVIVDQYFEFEEFINTIQFLFTKDFRDLIYKMEASPEFIAVIDFLEKDDIDILFFIDILNVVLDAINSTKKLSARQEISGTDFNSYMRDVTAALPKAKLQELYNEKMEQDPIFRKSMENLYSEEWNQIFTSFVNSPSFHKEAEILAENGIDVDLFFEQVVAVFGQL